MEYGFRKHAVHKRECEVWTLYVFIGALETFGSFPKKNLWWSHFCIREPELLLKEKFYH